MAGKTLVKSKKVFDSSKVTDHHAIIPTGVPAISLTDMERKVYDLVARAFISVFYPDCKFETTTVFGVVKPQEMDDVLFRTSGRVIVDEGWKVVYKSLSADMCDNTTDEAGEDQSGLPAFRVGESGPHVPSLAEKWTQPPKPYTEATLLRAMETAGKFVDNEELRDAMKENGIGRPSTRAAIIETLFKRRYIRKERKNLFATPTGIELIGIIHEELLKSAELTGIWEKKLREIEKKQYDAKTFIDELKHMVTDLVNTVRNDHAVRRVSVTTDDDLKKKSPRKKVKTSSVPMTDGDVSGGADNAVSSASNVPAGFQPKKKRLKKIDSALEQVKAEYNPDDMIGMPCPLCKEGHIIKGNAAYGCSRWKEGCTYRMPFGK